MPDSPENVVSLLEAMIRRGLNLKEQPIVAALDDRASPPDPPGMADLGERIAKLEGALDGLRHAQVVSVTLSTAIIGVLVAGGIAISIYILQRIDALPAEFERMNATLSAAVTAARQQPPSVILVPTPQVAPLPSPNGKP